MRDALLSREKGHAVGTEGDKQIVAIEPIEKGVSGPDNRILTGDLKSSAFRRRRRVRVFISVDLNNPLANARLLAGNVGGHLLDIRTEEIHELPTLVYSNSNCVRMGRKPLALSEIHHIRAVGSQAGGVVACNA